MADILGFENLPPWFNRMAHSLCAGLVALVLYAAMRYSVTGRFDARWEDVTLGLSGLYVGSWLVYLVGQALRRQQSTMVGATAVAVYSVNAGPSRGRGVALLRRSAENDCRSDAGSPGAPTATRLRRVRGSRADQMRKL
jgi:hypothetical protein